MGRAVSSSRQDVSSASRHRRTGRVDYSRSVRSFFFHTKATSFGRQDVDISGIAYLHEHLGIGQRLGGWVEDRYAHFDTARELLVVELAPVRIKVAELVQHQSSGQAE